MAEIFKYEQCMMKHYIRVKGWLPFCKARRDSLSKGKKPRRLRYFTFCAIGAVDVLMLDVARIIRPSTDGYFDTVIFFDRTDEAVLETRKRIPGAIGFFGSFTETVLSGTDEPLGEDDSDSLAPRVNEDDTAATRRRQTLEDQRANFRSQFPVDVINLDLEEFAFKEGDPFPGRVVNAMRELFGWQRRSYANENGKKETIDGFTLMFTTQVGPPGITEEYKGMLRDALNSNVVRQPNLVDTLRERFHVASIDELEASNFAEFFKIGMRKVLAGILMETDWYIDASTGIETFEFERQSKSGGYTMMHFVMNITRQQPPRERRAPLETPQAAAEAYARVADDVFSKPQIVVTDELAEATTLKPSLDDIDGRRRKYYRGEP